MTCQQRNGPVENNVIEITRFNSYTKLLRVTGRVIAGFKAKLLKATTCLPTPELLHNAEMYLIQLEQRKLQTEWEKAYRRLDPSIEQGIIYI